MRNTKNTNVIFFTIVAILLVSGFVFLVSASTVAGMERKVPDGWYYVKHQIMMGFCVGLPGLLFFSKFDYRKLKKVSLVLFILNILALLLTFVPFFSVAGEKAYRSLNLKFITFQPAEFLKITLILLLAVLFTTRSGKEHKNFWKTAFPFWTYLGVVSVILLLQPSTSIVIVLACTSIIMYWCSNFSIVYGIIGCIALLVIVGIIFVVLYASGLCTTVNKNTGQIQDRCLEYRWRRIQAFFNPQDESLSETYQPKQAKIGLGTGGWLGVGLGQSRQKYSYLPESFTDSIFAIIGEELGFAGSFGIILLFFFFYVSGLSIIKNAPDVFGSFLALGLISWIVVQAFIHILSTSGFIPLTGIPLPFISYGGSLYIVTLWSLGILINIANSN